MQQEKRTTVFVINGFLESGKTAFIRSAILRDPGIQYERVVILCCEEGEEEYTDLPDNIRVHCVEEKEDLTGDLLFGIDTLYQPTYVIIEYNGVWGMKTLYEAAMPETWRMAAQFTIIDAETFASYYANMKGIFADMLRFSARVYMNRCTREDDFKLYRDSIKSCAPHTEIFYISDEEGRLDIMLEDDLPYDVSGDVVTVRPEHYVTWYVDMLDNTERYVGKTVVFTAQIAKPGSVREGYFIAGNTVITCCEDDKEFYSFLCGYEKTDFLKEGALMELQGEVRLEFAPEYEYEGPVIYITKATTLRDQNKKKKKK
ncbi:MAG: GTPase [Clostridia bacterium]|nr:GTPase [Clostridia bacterium]